MKSSRQSRKGHGPASPQPIGIIGGSGLYQIEGLTRQEWVRMNTQFGKPSDKLLLGEIAGREVVFLTRHGRNHHLLPSELNHCVNI